MRASFEKVRLKPDTTIRDERDASEWPGVTTLGAAMPTTANVCIT
jgi:hypothetical protein